MRTRCDHSPPSQTYLLNESTLHPLFSSRAAVRTCGPNPPCRVHRAHPCAPGSMCLLLAYGNHSRVFGHLLVVILCSLVLFGVTVLTGLSPFYFLFFSLFDDALLCSRLRLRLRHQLPPSFLPTPQKMTSPGRTRPMVLSHRCSIFTLWPRLLNERQ